MSTLELEVLMAGQRAGRVSSASGRLRLRYHDAYRGAENPTPLSVNLPVQIAEHGHGPMARGADQGRPFQPGWRTVQDGAAI